MKNLEIPLENERHGHYRFFEILPGFLSYLLILTPLILSIINATAAVFFILFYLLIFFIRALAYSVRGIAGYIVMRKHGKLDWNSLSADIDAGKVVDNNHIERPKWHLKNLKYLYRRKMDIRPNEIIHAVIIATVNESREVLEPTITALLNSDFDPKRMIMVIAYEARAGQQTEDRVKQLEKDYGSKFKHSMIVKHPSNIKNEVIGKGGNITYAGKELAKYIETEKIDPARVLVTTLDSDNRVDPKYFSYLTYLVCIVPDHLKASYQPLAMYTNNIWDAPTLSRVIATGNNLFYIVTTQRQHMSRNFSAHAQPLKSLIDMNFWSTRTIVEDGHQFWRSYFFYEGDYRVYPFSIPIYQDAVLADGYARTIKAQFIQLRRWTYGASDIAYIADKGFFHKNKISKSDLFVKFFQTLESHVTWATAPIIVYFASFIPPFFHPQNLAANEVPKIVSRVQLFGIASLLVTVYVCLVTLPPRPARYKRHRSVLMLLQWALLPLTSLGYGCLAAFNSQTRLMFKWYLSKFDVTEKAVKMLSGETVSTEADPSRH